MTSKSTHNGRPIYYDETSNQWLYSDTHEACKGPLFGCTPNLEPENDEPERLILAEKPTKTVEGKHTFSLDMSEHVLGDDVACLLGRWFHGLLTQMIRDGQRFKDKGYTLRVRSMDHKDINGMIDILRVRVDKVKLPKHPSEDIWHDAQPPPGHFSSQYVPPQRRKKGGRIRKVAGAK